MTIPANKAKPFPLKLYPSNTAPAATIVQGKPGSFAQGCAPIEAQI